MASLTVITPEGLALERKLAGAGSRFGAAAVDMLLILTGFLVLLLGVALAAQFDPTGASQFVLGILAGGFMLILLGYQFFFALSWRGQTPGKRLFGLRVVSADGWPARTGQYLLRSLIWPLDVLLPVPTPFGLLGLVLVTVTARHQRLGDLVAGTVVVVEEPQRAPAAIPRAAQDPAGAAAGLDLQPGLAARLDDRDRAFLGDLLGRQDLDAARRRALFVSAARHYARRLDLGSFQDARALLREVYRFARAAREPG